MSKLAGGPWPSSLELEALSLPPGYGARGARETDRDTYVELSHETLGRYARDLHGLTDNEIRAGLHDEFQPQLAIVIERGDERIGVIVVEERSSELWIDHMVIAPSAQGRGIGTALVGWVQHAAASTGAAVTLSVVDGNPARKLYQRLGFTVTRIEAPRTFMEWRQP